MLKNKTEKLAAVNQSKETNSQFIADSMHHSTLKRNEYNMFYTMGITATNISQKKITKTNYKASISIVK